MTCSVCQIQLTNLKSFKKHLDQHKNLQSLNCCFCQLLFSDSKTLIRHIKLHLNKNSEQLSNSNIVSNNIDNENQITCTTLDKID